MDVDACTLKALECDMDTIKTKRWLTPLASAISLLLVTLPSYAVMKPLDDQALSQETGQAAFYTSFIDVGGSNPNPNIGFFTLGLNATVNLNANIEHLQLGCGGVKGLGCDIDLSGVSLVGVSPGPSGTYADTDAVITNPFIQLAIKNPTTLSTRELVGFNLGAQQVLGQLLIGNDPNPLSSPNPNNQSGIKSFSGSLGVNISNAVFTNVNVCVTADSFCYLNGSATVAAPGNTDYTTASNPNGFYQQQATLNRDSTLADLGPLIAHASGSLLGLTLSNVHLINEPLSNIHSILIEDSTSTSTNHIPTNNLSISLQNQGITYPTTSLSGALGWSPVQAAQGWWISIPSVVLADISSNQKIDIGTIAALGGAAFGTRVDIDPVDLQQFPKSNCYNGMKFC
jgi:hypothetical protein